MTEPPNRQQLYPTPREAFTVLIATFVLMLLFAIVSQAVNEKVFLVLSRFVFIVPMLVFLFIRRFRVKRVLRLNTVSLRMIAVSCAIGIGLFFVGEEIERIMRTIIPLPEELEQALNETLRADSFADWLVLLFGMVILDGVLEEGLFRGFLQNAFESAMDVTRAVLAVAFIFSLFYANPQVIVQIVLIGVILGVTAWKSDSILPAIFAHSMINLLGLFAMNGDWESNPLLFREGHIHPVLLVGAAALLYFGMKLFYRFAEEDYEVRPA